MKTLATIFLCISLCFGGIGCQSPLDRQQEQSSQGIYAVNDSLHAGRFDLAQVYSDQQVRVTPLPKHRIPIKPIYKSTNQ